MRTIVRKRQRPAVTAAVNATAAAYDCESDARGRDKAEMRAGGGWMNACRRLSWNWNVRDDSPLSRQEALLPDSLGFSAVMRLASTSTGWAERHAGLNVHVWPPNATRRSPSAYTFKTFPTWPSTYKDTT